MLRPSSLWIADLSFGVAQLKAYNSRSHPKVCHCIGLSASALKLKQIRSRHVLIILTEGSTEVQNRNNDLRVVT